MSPTRRLFSLLLVAALATALACTGRGEGAPADGDWSSRMTVRVEPAEAEGAYRVVFEGVPGWYMNTAYPGIRVALEPPDGLAFPSARLDREQVKYEDESPEDKAKRAVFTVPVTVEGAPGGPIEGEYRAVVCTDEICSPPFTGTFSVPVPES